MPPRIILSPHPDDAVLSLWHVLTETSDVRVVNVFGGSPEGTRGSSWWDRLTGATDPVARARERDAEDRQALSLAGREPESLGFVGRQHRDGEQSAEPIAQRVSDLAPAGNVIYAPACLDGHRGHRLVLAAALLLRRAGGHELALYADVPHSLVYGLPAWVTGAAPQPYLDPGAYWDEQLRAGGLAPSELQPRVHRLDPRALGRKLEAVRAYRTQLPALEAQFGRFTEGDQLAYEVVWSFRR